jgi:hypothetical protein
MGVVKHGHSVKGAESRAYMIWRQMRQRCSNPRKASYVYYGGRGIRVCPEWESFATFFADMGAPPQGMSLDRINNDAGYSKANCRWATSSTQVKNSRKGHVIAFGGESLNVCDWESRLGLSQGALWHRLRRGWSIEKALTTARGAT